VSHDRPAPRHTSGHSALNRIDAVMAAESQGLLPASESLIVADEGTGLGFTMKCKYSPNPWARVLAPFSMKWTLILSTAAFLASMVMAAIDDDAPQLVVWAGTVQFIVTVIVAADMNEPAGKEFDDLAQHFLHEGRAFRPCRS
jgi:hypothetical protein